VGAGTVAPQVNMIVGKTGRTTDLTQGRIQATGVSVNVNYGPSGVAHFRDQFSVQRVVSQDGGTLEVRSESAVNDRRVAMRLETDSAGTPVRYSVEERRGADVTLRLGGQRVRGRFATLARSSTGEAAREYLLRPGAVVVEEDGVVQYALLVRSRTLREGDGITLPSLTPIANTQGAVRLMLESRSDSIVVAGVRLVATRWRIIANSSDTRLVWTDAEGRLLRLLIPDRHLEALRDDVPREVATIGTVVNPSGTLPETITPRKAYDLLLCPSPAASP
jgi:hypothetical protein